MPFMQEVEGSTPMAEHVRMIFLIIFIDQDICTQCALSWNIVISERWPVIAVSLNIDSGIRLIKHAKLYMCTKKKHYKYNQDRCIAPGVWDHGSVPLSHSGNVVTRIGLQQLQEKFSL